MDRRASIKPYFKRSAERDHAHAATLTILLTFAVGAMCGASIALGVLG